MRRRPGTNHVDLVQRLVAAFGFSLLSLIGLLLLRFRWKDRQARRLRRQRLRRTLAREIAALCRAEHSLTPNLPSVFGRFGPPAVVPSFALQSALEARDALSAEEQAALAAFLGPLSLLRNPTPELEPVYERTVRELLETGRNAVQVVERYLEAEA